MTRVPIAKGILAILVFLFLPAALSYAGGQPEEAIKKAQTLIDAKQYKEALLVLQEIGTRDREKLDEVQLYINICMQHDQNVNELKQGILDAFDKDNDEVAVNLMDKLKALDPKELEFLGAAYEIKKLKVAYEKFQQIMDAASALIILGKYREAIDTYRQGFTLYRDEFLANQSYDKKDVADVQNMYIEIDALIAEYFAKAAVAERSGRAVADLFESGRTAEALTRSESALGDLDALLDLRWRLIGAGRRFRDENEYFKKKSPDGKGDNLFYFSEHTILGRETNNAALGREGVYYVAEASWEVLLEKTIGLLTTAAERLFRLARESEKAGNPDQADANDAQAEKFASRGAEYLGRYLDSGAPTAPRVLDGRDRKYLVEKYPRYVYLDEMASESRRYRALTLLRKRYETINKITPASADDPELKKNQAEARDAIVLLETSAAEIDARRSQVERLTADGFDMSDTARLLPDITSRLASLLSDFQKLNIGFVARIVERELKPVRDAYADDQKRLAEANAVRDGISPPPSPQAGEKHPSDAMKLYEALKRDLERENVAEKFLEKWRKESNAVLSDPSVKTFIEEAEGLAASLTALSSRVDAENERARVMRNEARTLYARAAEEYQKAGQALNGKNYSEATKQLGFSKKDVADSRANEETDQARRLAANVIDLEKKIRAASVDARLAESNAARDRGIESYFLQDFETARVLLDRAKKIILDLGTQENGDAAAPDTSDIQLWLDLVLKALATAPIRQINQKDPLYAEITARQKQAERYYQEGLDSQKKGRDADAQKDFQDALDQIQQIQKTFPQLKESGVLYIKVMQAQRGQRWYDSYTDNLVNEVERMDPKDAQAKLEDVLDLFPNNRRLKQALEKIVARLYVKPVVSAQAKDRAESLYREAAALVNRVSATRGDYDQAEKLVNQSLLLDPYSAKAKELQTRIRKVKYGR
ncbi:MAG: hypothetical protein JXD23_15740 [Spirochaetales bacterium]|nr:hypothetical protein [Spirochaetales bacterium]